MKQAQKFLARFVSLFAVALVVFSLATAGTSLAQEDDDVVEKPASGSTVHVLRVSTMIGPASEDFIVREMAAAQTAGAEMIVLEMDTPGGLMTSMKEIIKNILASEVPVALYVSPPGAHAASAGTFILYACHIAAMAEGTNIGAATPVAMKGSPGVPSGPGAPGGEEQSHPGSDAAMMNKAMNDSIAYIRGLAEMRDRNADWAERAVREAASLGAADALKEGVIDFIAADIDELLTKTHNMKVKVAGGRTVTLDTKDAHVVYVEPDWRTEVLSIITNPNVAFLLMSLGAYGLIYEFSNPGTFVPGVIGVICLMLGLFALNVLPINYAGLVLLFLGMAFMAGEAFIPSFGILGIGGLISFVIGATILIDSDVPGFGISIWTILGMGAVSIGVLTFLLAYVVRSFKKPVTTGQEELLGGLAEVINWGKAGKGEVRITGEIWTAVSPDGASFTPGEKVRITDMEGLKLFVGKPDADAETES